MPRAATAGGHPDATAILLAYRHGLHRVKAKIGVGACLAIKV
jgi:hypothetical protein